MTDQAQAGFFLHCVIINGRNFTSEGEVFDEIRQANALIDVGHRFKRSELAEALGGTSAADKVSSYLLSHLRELGIAEYKRPYWVLPECPVPLEPDPPEPEPDYKRGILKMLVMVYLLAKEDHDLAVEFDDPLEILRHIRTSIFDKNRRFVI